MFESVGNFLEIFILESKTGEALEKHREEVELLSQLFIIDTPNQEKAEKHKKNSLYNSWWGDGQISQLQQTLL